MKNIIYIRTSTEDQEPENQIKDCQALASKLNLDCEIVSDKQSAWSDAKEREGFESIKKGIINKQVTNLISWDLDRLFRNRKKLIAFFELCNINNCTIYSVRQQFLNVFDNLNLPDGFDFLKVMWKNNFLQFLGWIAEEESNKKSQRVKLAIRKDNGITASYKGNKWGRKNISQSTKQAIVEAYKKNLSYSKICLEVFYWDKNGNKKNVSKGLVHKIISEYKRENALLSDGHK